MYPILVLAGLLLFFAPRADAAAEILEIEVNQALGRQLDDELNFVAGKETVVRVFLGAETQIASDQSRLVIRRNGEEVATLAPRPYEQPVKVVEFLCPSMDACGRWAPGKYTFYATVNGATATTEGVDYVFRTRQRLRIMAVPVKANYAGTITTLKDDRWKQGWEFTRRTYPVAAEQVKWDVKDELDASGPQFDLETDEGQAALWEALKNLVPQSCTANPKEEGCYELVVGFISDRPMGYPNGQLQGFTFGRPANVVVASDEDMPATVAHEIAHVFGAGDTYEGGSLRCDVNPAPDGVEGTDWDDADTEIACMEGRLGYPDETFSATLIPAEHRPYEVGGRGALGNMACYMGNGSAMSAFWTTQDVYSQIFSELDPELLQVAAAKRRRQAGSLERMVHFSGYLTDRDEVRNRPWFTFLSADSVPDTTGDLLLRAVDAKGTVVASRELSVEFVVRSRPARRLSAAAFDGAIRFPESTVKFQVVRRGRVLAEMPVSARAPEVSGVTVADSGAIAWAGGDSDGDRLTYMVEYNRNPSDPDSPWTVVAAGLDAPQWQANLAALAGSPAARIRVTGSDGIRTASAESREFAVPFKAPRLNLETVAGAYQAGAEITLEGNAQDVQDGLIADSRLVWKSDLAGILGTGSRLVLTTLAAGNHTITLTATNSAGLSAVESVKVRVEE